MSTRALLRLKKSLLLLASSLLLTTTASCGSNEPPSTTVSRQDLGDQWPLTVDQVTLHCEVDGAYKYVSFDYSGTTYALNGSARQVEDDHNWTDFKPLWANMPDNPGGKIVVNDLVNKGLALCGAS